MFEPAYVNTLVNWNIENHWNHERDSNLYHVRVEAQMSSMECWRVTVIRVVQLFQTEFHNQLLIFLEKKNKIHLMKKFNSILE